MSWKNYNGYYVYTYLDENSVPYYVGMGSNNRMVAKHLYVDVPPYEQILVEDKLTQEEAWAREVELIALHGRKHLNTGPLLNLTKGGPSRKSGWTHSPLTKQRISNKNSGKVRTDEHKKNYRKPKTAEHAEKIRQANIGRKDDGRYIKVSLTKSKQRWYTNGIITRMFILGTEESGFVPGRKKVNQ